MTRPVALKSKLITMAKRVALRLWPVDTEPKARRTVKAAWSFSTVGRQEGRCHLCLKWATLVSESWVGQRQSLCQGCGAWGPPNSSLTESLRVLESSHGCSEYSQCPDMAILSSHNVLQAVPRTWNLPTGILNTHNVLARLF